MAKKVILKDHDNNEIMPITRGELILDSSGNEALHSNEFLATDTKPGLMSKEDKLRLINMSAGAYGDADTVDGKHASDFLSITGGTMQGTINLIQDTSYIKNSTTGYNILGINHTTINNTGVVGNQVFVGDATLPLTLRGQEDLIHSINGNTYPILDTNNYKTYVLCKRDASVTIRQKGWLRIFTTNYPEIVGRIYINQTYTNNANNPAIIDFTFGYVNATKPLIKFSTSSSRQVWKKIRIIQGSYTTDYTDGYIDLYYDGTVSETSNNVYTFTVELDSRSRFDKWSIPLTFLPDTYTPPTDSYHHTYEYDISKGIWTNENITSPLFTGNLDGSATSLTTNAGSATQPVYFSGGIPVAGNKLEANILKTTTNTNDNYFWSKVAPLADITTINIVRHNAESSSVSWLMPRSPALVFGISDTRGLLSIAYRTPKIVFGGGTTGNDKTNPNWTISLLGTSNCTYTLPTKTSTLASIDEIPTKTSQLIKDDVYMKSEVYNTSQVNELINALDGVVGGIIDTWRPIHVQNSSGSNILTLGDGSTSGDITLKAGTNLTASVVGSTVTFDTTYNLFDLYTQSQKGIEAYNWGNHAGKYLSLSGGTLTALSSSVYAPLTLKTVNNTNNNIIYFVSKNSNLSSVGHWNNFSFIANETTYARIGVTDEGVPQFWTHYEQGNRYTLLHEGNYNLYSPKLDGTGAIGTWNININGDAKTLEGYTPNAIFRGSFFKNEAISTTQAGWVTIAAVDKYVRSRIVFMIQSTGSSMAPRSTIVSIDFSWDTSKHIIKISNSYYITGVRVCLIGNTNYVDIYCNSQLTSAINLIVPMPYDSLANANASTSWYFGNLQLQYTPSDSIVYNTCMSIGRTTYSDSFAATSFLGNLDGTYVNKLTGYTKATSASNIAATDSLNTALGKLEYKAGTTYDWYKSITQDDTDTIINKWGEIVDFIDSVAEGTDITDEFVTRKTEQTITGTKTFECASNTIGIPIKLRNIGWAYGMQTGIDFYNGTFYTVPNARITTYMDGYGGASGGHLKFYTQSKSTTNPNPNGLVERMIITDTGNVGIGVSNPSVKLQVTGDIYANDDIYSRNIYINGRSGGNVGSRAVLILNSPASTPADIIFKCNSTSSNVYGTWAISSRNDTNYRFSIYRGSENVTNKSEKEVFSILANGNVGIDNSAPQEKLHVSGNILAAKFITSGGTSSQFVKGDGSLDSNRYLINGSGAYTTSYLRDININGNNWTFWSPVSSGTSGTVYGPTTPGTSGQYLMSNGSGAPVWTSLPALASPYAIKFKNTAGTEVSYNGSVAVDLTGGIEYAKLASQLSSTRIFGFENKKSSYCKIATISISSRYTGKYGLLKCYTTLTTIPNADNFEIFICAYQQDALGNSPVIKFKTTNTNNLYQVIGLLNYTSTNSTLDIYIYGYNRIYLSLNTSLISGNIVISPESYVDSLPSGIQIIPTPMGNVEMLNGYLDSDFWKKTELTKVSQLTNDSGYLTSLPSHTHDYIPFEQSVNGKNMDTIKTTGFYYGYTMTNSANTSISSFIVAKYSPDWGSQIQLCSYNSRAYIRYWQDAGGVMGTWKTVAYTSDIPTSLPANGGNATTVGDGTISIVPQYNNEINFGGTNTSSVIYLGYRAVGSIPIPTSFVFGGSTGTSKITANSFISSVATGTQPYACSSTTVNTNLNADLLDGYHASSFALKTDLGSAELANNITTISKTLTVTQNWMDTGIKHTDLPNDGTYIIQIYTHNSTDGLWYTYWSGIMSWFQQETNDNDSDEIILHRAGYAYSHTIYLRTIMTGRSDGRNLRLQIAADTNLSTASTYTFKFKRVI